MTLENRESTGLKGDSASITYFLCFYQSESALFALCGGVFLPVCCSVVHRQLLHIKEVQIALNCHSTIIKVLPHLARRNDDIVREVLAFICIMLFNANRDVQVSSRCHLAFQPTNKEGRCRSLCVSRVPGDTAGSFHLHLSLNREGRLGTTDDFTTSFLHFFLCFPLPSWIWQTPGLSIP